MKTILTNYQYSNLKKQALFLQGLQWVILYYGCTLLYHLFCHPDIYTNYQQYVGTFGVLIQHLLLQSNGKALLQ
jgi:hypothetical protein